MAETLQKRAMTTETALPRLVWTTRVFALKDLKPYEHNPRRMTKAAYENLKRSLQEDGYHQRLVADVDGTIIGGHQRLRALTELGFSEVEVLLPSRKLTPEEFDRINIRDNLPFGDFDFDILANRFDASQLVEWGMPEKWLPLTPGAINQPVGDADSTPEVQQACKTQRGDIFEIGPHRLLCGDSTYADQVDKLMNGQEADLFLTDPPYNVEYVGKTKDALTIENDRQPDEEFREFLATAFATAKNYMKPGAVFYIWHADSEGYNFRHACQACGLEVRQCLIWQKNCFVMGRQDYHWQHEPCLYGWKDGAAHLWATDRKQSTLLVFDRPARSEEHPTMKPVALFAYQLGNNTKEGDLILDSFGGSGTTMVAAHQQGRRAYLMELDPHYCEVIVQRMHNLFPDLEIKRNGEPVPAEQLNP